VIEVVAWVLILLAAGDVAVTLVLVRAAQHVREPALSERAGNAAILTFVAILWAVLAVAALTNTRLPSPIPFVLLCLGFVLVSAPQYIWVFGLWLGKFK